jgi:hypothetical protein
MIQQSWDAVTESTTLSAIGGCIYETLFEIAPNLRHLFRSQYHTTARKGARAVGFGGCKQGWTQKKFEL